MYSLVLLTMMSTTAPAPGWGYYGTYYGPCYYGYYGCGVVYYYPTTYPRPFVVRPAGPTAVRPTPATPQPGSPVDMNPARPRIAVPPPDLIPKRVIAPFQERDEDAPKKIERKDEEAPKKMEKKDDANGAKKEDKKDDDTPKKDDKKDDAPKKDDKKDDDTPKKDDKKDDTPKKDEKKDDDTPKKDEKKDDTPKKDDKKDDDTPKKDDKKDEKDAATSVRLHAPEGLSTSATLVVHLPANARLYVNEALCSMTSATRTIRTPRLEAGRNYTYTIKTEVVRGGQTVVQTRQVTFQAGNRILVDFSAAPINTAQR